MLTEDNLNRFLVAQKHSYQNALSEIKNGRKQSHWMWYIFPQIQGLGYSETARFYSIKDLAEAKSYLNDPILGKRLIEISSELLKLNGKSAHQIFGSPDDMKLRSSMTLFANVPNADLVFKQVLEKYFIGENDELTLEKITQWPHKI